MRRATDLLASDDDGRAVSEQALIDCQTDLRPVALAPGRLIPQLPDEFTHLGDRLGRDGLAETRQPPAGVDGNAAPEGGVAVAEQAFGFALLAQPDVLVPVELER